MSVKLQDYEYMQPLVSLDEVNGEFITKKITLASETDSPLSRQRHTLWANIPGGYWDYTNPWTKKALDMIIEIQIDLDAGRELSRGMNWHHCPLCDKWTNSYYIVCPKCNDDDYEEFEG